MKRRNDRSLWSRLGFGAWTARMLTHGGSDSSRADRSES